MSVNIFLDDCRNPEDVTWVKLPDVTYVVIRSYEDFIWYIKGLAEPIDHITFDHDLGFGHGKPDSETPTGYDCAKALVEHCQDRKWKLPHFIVHSLNPVGKNNIEKYLVNARAHLEC